MKRARHHAIYWLSFLGLGVLLIDSFAYPHGAFGLCCLVVATALDYWRNFHAH